jgi:hypothetical protein
MRKRVPARPLKVSASSDRDFFIVCQLAASISIAAFFYYLQKSQLLLYGDAVAHINIARRVFDSHTPGLLQLGTVWLPLPHILTIPFITSRFLWQTGIGGAVPSMAAYVFSVAGIFRFMRTVLPKVEGGDHRARVEVRFTAWLAAGIFALNPNLIYLQTTAMTESLYLAFSIWAIVFFAKALRCCSNGDSSRGNSALVRSGLCLIGACLCRYDGWLLATVLSLLSLALSYCGFSALRRGATKLVLLAATAPAIWLAYNAAVYGNPLEFANGPYSAKAIEQKTAVPGMPAHPGDRDLRTAFKYYFKSAELNMAPGKLQIFWVLALLFGTAVVTLFQRKLWPSLLLWIPVPFYMLSVAYGGIPIFLPVWWPHSYYNTRYGIELLPAFPVLGSIAAYGLIRFAASTKARISVTVVFLALAVASYAEVWRSGPISLEEALVNSRSRTLLERQLASIFRTLPANTRYLMYLGDHVGAFQQAGIPLSNTVNEGNHRPWKRPSDPEGLWERALVHPSEYADVVIAFDRDPVATQANQGELKAITILRVSGQPEATIYQTIRSNHPR